MLVDPRPYTYEYRKPRFSNPTFQSRNLYGSMYHTDSYQVNDYFAPSPPQRYQSSEKLTKASKSQAISQAEANILDLKDKYKSSEFVKSKPPIRTDDPEKYQSSFKLPSINKNIDHPRAQNDFLPMVNAAGNNNHQSQRRQGFERFKVYEGQQHQFNIINCYPKQQTSYRLRNFPKLTLEDRLIERGTYHKFD